MAMSLLDKMILMMTTLKCWIKIFLLARRVYLNTLKMEYLDSSSKEENQSINVLKIHFTAIFIVLNK